MSKFKPSHVKRKIEEMIDYSNWIVVSAPGRMLSKGSALFLYVTNKANKLDDPIKNLRLRLSADLMQEMKLKAGDYITMVHNPDNVLDWVLFKSQGGRVIGKEVSTNAGLVNFTWDTKYMDNKRSRELKYEVKTQGNQKYLKFWLNEYTINQDDSDDE